MPIGVGVGQGLQKGPLDAAVAPVERTDQEVLQRAGAGADPAGGCLAVAAPLCFMGGREHICWKLQEADEVLIC